MKIHEVLIEAHHLMFNGDNCWTKETYARNKDGKKCSAYDSSATCWCWSGAVGKASYPNLGLKYNTLDWLKVFLNEDAPTFNDRSTKEEVFNKSLDAITAAKHCI